MSKRICIIKDCGKELGRSGGRGLCHDHYQEIYYLVKAGQTTWEEAQRLGLCSNKRQSSMAKLLEEKKEQERIQNENSPRV